MVGGDEPPSPVPAVLQPKALVFSLKATQLTGAADCGRDSEVGIVNQLGRLGEGWQCPGSFLSGGSGPPAMGRAAVRNGCLESLASLFL